MRKKTRKRSVLSLLLFMLLMIIPVTAYAKLEASDLDNHWAASAIEKCYDYKIIEGYGEGIFAPDRKVSRAEFVTIVNRAFGYDTLDISIKKEFKDLDGNLWYANDMNIAVSLGIITGFEDGSIRPLGKVTREQAATILYRTMRLNSLKEVDTNFSDIDNVSKWAKEAVISMEKKKYIKGHNGVFRPKDFLSRGEAAQIICNVFGEIIDDNYDVKGKEFENLTIRRPNLKLENIVVNGDLFITEAVVDGDIWLENATVNGRILVSGGGENSIYLKNVKIAEDILMDKPASIGEEYLKIRIISNSETVNLNAGKINELLLSDDLIIKYKPGDGTASFNFSENETNLSKIHTSKDSIVDKIVAYSPTTLEGNGVVKKVEIHTPGTIIERQIDIGTLEADKDIIVIIGEESFVGNGINNPTPNPNPIPSPTPPSGGGSTSKNFTVTFNSNGGTSVATQTVKSGMNVQKPSEPQKDNAEFLGWYKESTFINLWEFENDTVNSNVQLYARWKNTDLLAFTSSAIEKTYGNSSFTNELVNNSGAIGFESSAPVVATIDSNGKVSILSAGSTTIKATRLADEENTFSTATYTLTVLPAKLTLNADKVNGTLIPFGDSENYAKKITLKLSISGLVGTDKITANLETNSFGVSLENNTNIADGATIKIVYDGTTTVNSDKEVSLKLKIANNKNYVLSSESALNITIRDGETESRAIPIFQSNIKDFNTYANTTDGLNKNYIQMENIVLTSPELSEKSNWISIGTSDNGFAGTYDGDEHIISNMIINELEPNYDKSIMSMFDTVEDEGVIKNLKLYNCSITSENFVGGIVSVNTGTISNCHVTGDIQGGEFEMEEDFPLIIGGNNTGGIASSNNGYIDNCSFIGNMSGNFLVGGIAAFNIGGEIVNCQVKGEIKSNGEGAGGIVAHNEDGLISSCLAEVDIYDSEMSFSGTGGISGINMGMSGEAKIINCAFDGKIFATNNSMVAIGGIVGMNEAEIINCYSKGILVATNSIGGIAGMNGYDSNILNCVALTTKLSVFDYSPSNIGRISGFNTNLFEDLLNNNYALDSMKMLFDINDSETAYEPIGTDTSDGKDGESVSLEQINLKEFWDGSRGKLTWDFENTWTWDSSKQLPILTCFTN